MNGPRAFAEHLRVIASKIENSTRPDRRLVAADISQLISILSSEECAQEETVAVNVPKDVERYVKEVKDKNPGYTDAQAWATAWSIYCKNKNPDSPHCHQTSY